jgi:hypothetical protein
MPELTEGLLPLKENCHEHLELAVDFVLFSHNFLKWEHLVSVASFLMKGSIYGKWGGIRI